MAQWFEVPCIVSLPHLMNVFVYSGGTQVFVEQCRELDIAVAISPKNTNRRAVPTSLGHGGSYLHNGGQPGMLNSVGHGSAWGASFSGKIPANPVSAGNTGGGLGGMGHGNLWGGTGPVAPSSKQSGFAALEKFGKELNKSLLVIMQVRV